MKELQQLIESLKREVELLKELVKAKDDLITAMKFAPAPIIIREQAPIMTPFIQTIPVPQFPQPPFVVTCESGQNAPIGTESGHSALMAESRAAQSIALTQAVNEKLDEMGVSGRNVTVLWNKSKAK